MPLFPHALTQRCDCGSRPPSTPSLVRAFPLNRFSNRGLHQAGRRAKKPASEAGQPSGPSVNRRGSKGSNRILGAEEETGSSGAAMRSIRRILTFLAPQLGKTSAAGLEPGSFLPMAYQGGIALAQTSHWLQGWRFQMIESTASLAPEAVNSCIPNLRSSRKSAPL